MAIPVIDLLDFPQQSEKLLQACQEWGCFRIVNHNISRTLMSEMKSVVRSFFDLPLELKRRNVDAIAGSGYVAPTKINPLYEALGLYDMASSEAVGDFCTQLDASPHQREIVETYAKAIHELAMDIGQKLAKSMGLVGEFFSGWPCQFRINKYHFTPESVGSPGVQIHTDSSFLTILQEDESVGGLEVEKSGTFVAVDPMPGSLLVNLGDIAAVWSNGRLCNVRHRVMCKEASIRVSIATFFLGPKEGLVAAPEELVDAENPRLFVPFTYEDFRKLRISSKSHAGEALLLVRADALKDQL